MEVFGSSGIRGIANVGLTPADVLDVARAAGTVWRAERVAVGRDTRTSGPMLESAATAGLAAVGASVDRLGVVPTPALQAHAEREGVPGLMVTASHNPPAYNGIKLIGADGVELPVEELEAVETVLAEDTAEDAGWASIGDVRDVDGTNRRYLEEILDDVDREPIADADLTVAIDPGHGAGSATSPELFRRLGCHVVTTNAQPDGRFPGRDPEPVAANLGDLRRLVRAAEADLGIAHDGDADRAVFVDETGEVIEGDAALAALAADVLSAGDVVVSAVNVSQRLADVAEDREARLELTPIGSTRILTRVRELQAAGERVSIAGEGNGGIVLPDFRLARDGAYAAARFVGLLADSSASAVVGPYDDYHNVRLDVPYDDETERAALLAAAADLAESADAEVTTVDGYRLDYGDGWVLARASGTEPLVRVYAEAADHGRAEALADRMRRALESAD